MGTLPTGTVTFLFTDIEGSTKLAQEYPDDMQALLARHNEILDEVIKTHGGFLFRTVGDAYCVAFHNSIDALNSALEAQRQLHREAWSPASIKVRMGIHTGAAQLLETSKDVDYSGYATLALVQRIMSAGHGGQILISEITLQVAREHLPADISTLDLGQHHLKGLNRPEHIFQLNAPDLRQDFPALKSQTHATNNLPTQLTSFIGRERELAEASSRLEGARLLTMIGPGGTGKTRLSVQLGTELLETFKDGVWLVELAPISDPLLVMQTIAAVLGIQEAPGVPLQVLVLNYLREKQLLLILDNCEHLVEASAKVADEFLHNASSIKIIASSREALGINGESVYRVPSLSLPNQDKVTREAALGYESVQLFVDRASAANPKFQLTDENASAVAQICSRLDGIPLAIELSASRIPVFSPEQIAKRLDDRFKLLTGGSRTALPRQQTLRALIDWSYDLLSEDERALLRRLSVFAGGWTFEAAEMICSVVDVFEHLPQLVNKSLVVVKDEGDEKRFFLLETIRQYARDKLLENDEGAGTRDRHLEYYLSVVETAQPEMLKKDKELSWLKRLEGEYDNIRTAIEWSLSYDPFAVLRIVYSLTYFMVVTSYASEAHRWGVEALERVKLLTENGRALTGEEKAYRAKGIGSLAIMSFTMGDNQTAVLEAEEAIQELRHYNDKQDLAVTLAFLAGACVLTGNNKKAITASDEALQLAIELEDKLIFGQILTATSRVEAFGKGDLSKAYSMLEEAIKVLKEHGPRWSYGIALYSIGNLAINIKKFDVARVNLKTARQVMQELGSIRNVSMIKSELAHILRYEGNYIEAIPAYQETIREWQRMGHRSAVAHQLECMAFIAKAREQTEKSTRLLGAAEALRERIEINMTPQELKEYEEEIADLKANMEAKEFASLWADGRSMTMDEAIGLALEEIQVAGS